MSISLSALAGTKAGVKMPDVIQVDGERLFLNGLGVREATMLKVDVYVAGLYLEQRTSSAEAILRSNDTKRLVLYFLRDVDRDDITEAWEEGFEKNAGNRLGALRDRIAKLNGWMTGMKAGETLLFTYLPEEGVRISAQGKRLGTIPGEDFAQVFFAIWLGSEPPNQGLKTGLLGGGG